MGASLAKMEAPLDALPPAAQAGMVRAISFSLCFNVYKMKSFFDRLFSPLLFPLLMCADVSFLSLSLSFDDDE